MDGNPVRGRDEFHKVSAFLNLIARYYRLFPQKRRIKLMEKHRYSRGKFGLGIRYALLKSIALQCGDNVGIHEGVFMSNPQNLRIGTNVSIQPMCYIECGLTPEQALSIGDDVSIAHGVTVMATTHQYGDIDIPIKDQGVESKETIIGNNVWIGSKAVVLAGKSIQSGCVIGAGAVITKPTKPDGLYGGVPARLLKKRT